MVSESAGEDWAVLSQPPQDHSERLLGGACLRHPNHHNISDLPQITVVKLLEDGVHRCGREVDLCVVKTAQARGRT